MKILAFRFSSLGDVALSIPVVVQFLEQNPSVEIVYVSRPFYAPLFNNIDRLQFFSADVDKEFKGITGLRKLHRRITKEHQVDMVADLHDSSRTHLLNYLFNSKSRTIRYIDKGRDERRILTRRNRKIVRPIQPVSERYANVFRDLGFQLELNHTLKPWVNVPDTNAVDALISNKPNRIGVAPFSKHKGKTYPLDKLKLLIEKLASNEDNELYFFGSPEEKKLIQQELGGAKFQMIPSDFTLAEELYLISKLKVMISMDSANMHLASLMGVKAISIWGATHPYLGFLGYGQSFDDTVQMELSCRPCSAYGNKPCHLTANKHQCMDLDPELILQKL